ncbi:MAG: hypothetical protein H9864_06645, partial [Candidatus Faecalibacterium intestinavium]|nr:hypothetical protein [Candidatus Faecalibacterium intestinavium]
MKAKMYIAKNGFAYRASEDGQSVQFLDTTMHAGWKRSDYMTGKVFKTGRPAQEVMDEEASRNGWQPWEEPEESAAPQSNAVQLAAILADRYKRSGGEMTAEGFKKAMGTGGHADSQGFIDFGCKGVSIRPLGEPETKYTWAKFIKFCKENGLIENPTAAAGTAPQNAPIASDAQSSPCLSSGADVPTEEKTPLNSHCKTGKSPTGHCGAAAYCNEPYECCAPCPNDCNSRCGWISAKEESTPCKPEPAPKPAAAATMAAPAVTPAAETSTTLESAADAAASTPKPSSPDVRTPLSAPASPAEAGAVTHSLSAAAPVSSEVQPLVSSAFDYTGLDRPTVDTLHWAEREICDARRDYVARLAQAVYIAHDALLPVANCDGQRLNNNQHSEKTFIQWCASVGLGKDTAYRLLQVAALLNGSTPEEQAVLEAASPSLLYAAAKPSAPAQLVQAVKEGDITTHKQYQDLLARLRDKEQELASVQQEAALDRKEQEDANAAALRYKAEADRRAQDQQRLEGRIKSLEAQAREAERNLAGAREALTAAKARGDRWKEKAEALEAQAAAPAIEAKVIDPEEVE